MEESILHLKEVRARDPVGHSPPLKPPILEVARAALAEASLGYSSLLSHSFEA